MFKLFSCTVISPLCPYQNRNPIIKAISISYTCPCGVCAYIYVYVVSWLSRMNSGFCQFFILLFLNVACDQCSMHTFKLFSCLVNMLNTF